MSSKDLEVELILWDPTSEAHVSRIRQQRLSCGWGAENVDKWRNLQLSKQKVLYWIVLKPDHAEYHVLLNKYAQCFPLEKDPLVDTESVISPRFRIDTFIPIGHASLDLTHNAIAKPEQGIYGASNLYIPTVLRGYEFARQAIEALKFLVAAPPYYGQFLVAEVLSRESYEQVERNKLLGDGGPKFSLVEWYESLGWKQLKESLGSRTETDTNGKTFMIKMVAIECDIRGYWKDMMKAHL